MSRLMLHAISSSNSILWSLKPLNDIYPEVIRIVFLEEFCGSSPVSLIQLFSKLQEIHEYNESP